MKKLSKNDLDIIRSNANRYFSDLTNDCLTDTQFVARCWTEAVCNALNIQGVEYPYRQNCEPIEDIGDYEPPKEKKD